eukprot:g3633.t1
MSFGGFGAKTSTPGGGFGTTTTPGTTGGFGGFNKTPATTTSGFGNKGFGNVAASNPAGASTAPATTTGGFGSFGQQAKPKAPTTGGFGGFGQQTKPTAPATGGFGATTGGFGASKPAVNPTGGGFGSSGFGQPLQQTNQQQQQQQAPGNPGMTPQQLAVERQRILQSPRATLTDLFKLDPSNKVKTLCESMVNAKAKLLLASEDVKRRRCPKNVSSTNNNTTLSSNARQQSQVASITNPEQDLPLLNVFRRINRLREACTQVEQAQDLDTHLLTNLRTNIAKNLKVLRQITLERQNLLPQGNLQLPPDFFVAEVKRFEVELQFIEDQLEMIQVTLATRNTNSHGNPPVIMGGLQQPNSTTTTPSGSVKKTGISNIIDAPVGGEGLSLSTVLTSQHETFLCIAGVIDRLHEDVANLRNTFLSRLRPGTANPFVAADRKAEEERERRIPMWSSAPVV